MDEILRNSYVSRKAVYVVAHDRTHLARVVRYDDEVLDLEDAFTGKLTLLTRSAVQRISYVDIDSCLSDSDSKTG